MEFLAAHNASFDRSVLLACCARYRLRAPRTPFTCTVQLARAQWGIYPTTLPDVCDSFVFCSITTTPGRTRKRARASYSPPRPQATREDGHPRRDGRCLWRLASPVGARRTNSAAISDQAAGETALSFWHVRKHRVQVMMRHQNTGEGHRFRASH